MPIDVIPDPFSMVMAAMWKAVTDSDVMTKLVKRKNLVRYDEQYDRSPLKDEINTADTPELILVPGTLAGDDTNLHDSSSGSRICQSFRWLLSTGDFRATKFVMPIGWALVCAMSNWKDWGLTWQGQSFVKKVDIRGGTVGESDAQRNRGIAGWSFISEVHVTMMFQTSLMQAYGGE